MKFVISKRFTFEAAHNLVWHEGKCRNIHGHSYVLMVFAVGDLDSNGVIMDFGDLKKLVNDVVIDVHDHKYLNELYENPTAELMAGFILQKLNEEDERIFKVRLYETESSYCEVEI